MNNTREMMSVLRADLQSFVLTEVETNLYNLAGTFGVEIFDMAPSCYVSGVEFPLYLSPEASAMPVGTIAFKGDDVHFSGDLMGERKATLERGSDVLQVRLINKA